MHVIFGIGLLALAIFCSIHRKQLVSNYFTIYFTFAWFLLDSVWRSVYATWNHPEFKCAWYILTM